MPTMVPLFSLPSAKSALLREYFVVMVARIVRIHSLRLSGRVAADVPVHCGAAEEPPLASSEHSYTPVPTQLAGEGGRP